MDRLTRIVAHRGGARLWPENSMAAIRGSIDLGVHAVEIDVHLSADGVPVVIHDPTWDRTTTGSGLVRHTTVAQLKDPDGPIRIQTAAGTEAIPTLAEVLETMATTSVGISVELKLDENMQPYPGLVPAVLADLAQHGFERSFAHGGAFLHAFHWAYLETARSFGQGLDLGCNVKEDTLFHYDGRWEALLDAIEHLGVRHVNADHRLTTDGMLAQTKLRGFELSLWTVNDDEEISRFLNPLAPARPDHICTDRPDHALSVRSSFETCAA